MADIEQTRAVVDAGECYDGRIIPSNQTAINRPVRIRKEATVQGSVHGTSVSIDAEATVDGSVMAGEAVELTGGHVRGEVGTPGRVTAKNAQIEGTVTGKRVRVQDCVIRGNVVGTHVIIENSVVLGLATASRELTIEDSLCYSFRAQDDVVADGTITVLPQAIVDGDLTLASPVRVAGLGEVDAGDTDRLPEMTENDLYEHENGTYLTIGPRILNLSKAQDRLAELEDSILEISSADTQERPTPISEVLESIDIDVDELSDDIGVL